MYKRDKLFIVVLIGPSGAGKTTLAQFLRDQLVNTAHVSTDNIKRFISEYREVDSHNKVSRNIAAAMAGEYLKNGISVIADKNMDNEELDKYKEIAEKHSVDFFLYRIEAHPDIRNERIADRAVKTNKPMMSPETIDKLSKRYEENTHQSHATFDSEKLSTEEIANFILKDLGVI